MPSHSVLLSQLYRLTTPPPGDAELLRRWVERRDEDAFTALVSRHGRMVFGVCRRVLGNSHDAEDAFQAVFLTLARKAASLRHPEALPGWLHGVAVRLSCKARSAAVRRRCGDQDSSACEPLDPHPDPLDTLSARELLGLIDREIARLPDAYRLPLVLCDLEGRTQGEAAQLLGWTLGSLRGRLLRGRERLRTRLTRRGIAPTALAAACMQDTADAAALTASVSRLAVRFAVCPASVPISPSVAALIRDGMRGIVLAKLKFASIILLVACTFVAGAGLLAWSNSTPQPVEDKPAATPPSAKPHVRRDQAGDLLPAEAMTRLGTTRLRHGGPIMSLAFGPDGKSLVSCGRDGLRFWDTATGKEIQRFPEQTNAQGIAISPDGKLLAIRLERTNPKSEGIAIREFATGRLLRRFGDRFSPWSLRFSPDGKVLAAYRAFLDIELWDPISGRHLHTLKGHERVTWSIAFSADSKTLVSGGDDKTIRFWDVATGKELRQIKHSNQIAEVGLSADGRLLASIDFIPHIHEVYGGTILDKDNLVRLWDAATGKELRRLTLPAQNLHRDGKAGIESLEFAPDGKTLLTGGADGTLHFWDPSTGKVLRQIAGFTVGMPREFAFSPDGKSLAVVDCFSTIRLLDLASAKDRLQPLGHLGRVFSISVVPDGQAIATMSLDDTVRFWDPATGRELLQREAAVDYMQFAGLRPDGQTYLTVGRDKLFRLNDLASGKEKAILRGHQSPFPFVLSPDGKTLASVNANRAVRLIDPATGAMRHTLTKVKHQVWGMAFTADGCTLVVWDTDGIVSLWNAATGQRRGQFTVAESGMPAPIRKGPLVLYSAALSPDGKLLAFGLQTIRDKEKILPVVSTTCGKVVLRLPTAEDGASQVAFSPDGKSLAWSGPLSTTVYLGELASGRVRQRFAGHTGNVGALTFSADGKMLISGSNDTTALVWDLTGRLTMGKHFGKALSSEELETHWKTLAGDDAEAAFRAIQTLAADPARSIPYLRARFHPVAPGDEKRVQQWIADLDSDQFAVREKATSELRKAGISALQAMRKALEERPSLEKRRRLEPLIEMQEREEWSPSAENLRIRRALEVLERVGTAEATDVLMILANGAAGAWQTLDAKAALHRLAQRSIR